MKNIFLIRPSINSTESLESFFIRVANKNGYDDVHRFLEATKRFLQDIDHHGYQTPEFNCEVRHSPISSSHCHFFKDNRWLLEV